MNTSFADLAVAGIRGLKPYQPGKPISELERELGIKNIIKMASNENPLGPPPSALAAIGEAMGDLALYPDGNGYDLKSALARRHSVEPENITLGNGSNDILVLLAEAFLSPNLEAIYSRYAFAAYPIAVQCTGATARVAEALAEDTAMPLGHDLEAMHRLIGSETRLIFIANPNNPTGTWLRSEELERFLDAVPQRIIVVVDEAYWDYVTEDDYPDTTQWLSKFPNLVVTRTFSKAFGLAGLRIGYSVCNAEIADMLNRVRQPFNTNIPAQVAALAAIEDTDFLTKAIASNQSGLEQLKVGLTELGLDTLPSVCNFLLADMGRPAGEIFTGLLQAGIIVRPVENYGLPDHLRISVGLEHENQRLIRALETVLADTAPA